MGRMVPKYNPKTDYYKDFSMKLLSGGLAGGLANVVCYPFDFARTRLASDLGKGQGQFNGIADCIMKTVQTGGIPGLYRGSAITVAGAFVYRGGQLGLFAQIQDMNPYKADKGMVGIVAAFVCATVARTITTPFNYPFDTIRRRMMLDSDKPAEERLYKSAIDCFIKVSKNEGAAGMSCSRRTTASSSSCSDERSTDSILSSAFFPHYFLFSEYNIRVRWSC